MVSLLLTIRGNEKTGLYKFFYTRSYTGPQLRERGDAERTHYRIAGALRSLPDCWCPSRTNSRKNPVDILPDFKV